MTFLLSKSYAAWPKFTTKARKGDGGSSWERTTSSGSFRLQFWDSIWLGLGVFSFCFAVKGLGVNMPTLVLQQKMSKMAPECVHRARGSGACECRVCIKCSSLYIVLLIIRSCIIVIIVVADTSAHSSCTAIALPPYTFCNSFFSYANAQKNQVYFLFNFFARLFLFLKPATSECKFQTLKNPNPNPDMS